MVGRAVDQLVRLTGAVEAKTRTPKTFPQADVELTRGNFAGAGVAAFVPQGSFLAVAADFRAATVSDWDLTQVAAPKLSSAFFTCANLQKSDLGTANLAGADFTGANLRGADLSEVQNLTRAQIRGALVGPATRLPGHLKRYAKGWGIVEDDRGVPSFAGLPAPHGPDDRPSSRQWLQQPPAFSGYGVESVGGPACPRTRARPWGGSAGCGRCSTRPTARPPILLRGH